MIGGEAENVSLFSKQGFLLFKWTFVTPPLTVNIFCEGHQTKFNFTLGPLGPTNFRTKTGKLRSLLQGR